jgi:hypothetical protein
VNENILLIFLQGFLSLVGVLLLVSIPTRF